MLNDFNFRSSIYFLDSLFSENGTDQPILFKDDYEYDAPILSVLELLNKAVYEGIESQKNILSERKQKIIALNALLKSPSFTQEISTKVKMVVECDIAAKIKQMQIAVPMSKYERMIESATKIPRITFGIFSDVILTHINSLFTFKNIEMNPKFEEIKIGKTPILILHDCKVNGSEWSLKKELKENPDYGSFFSLNCEKLGSYTTEDSLSKFVKDKVSPEIKRIQSLTKSDNIILIGFVYGGILAAYYANKEAKTDGVTVDAIISVSTPWEKITTEISQTAKWLKNWKLTSQTENSHLYQKVARLLNPDFFPCKCYHIWSLADPALLFHKSHLTLDPRKHHTYWTMGSYTTFASTSTWNKIDSWLQEIYEPQRAIRQLFRDEGIAISYPDADKIKQKFGIETVKTYLSKGFRSVRFFLEHSPQSLKLVNEQLKSGATVQFFLEKSYTDLKKVLEWGLKVQEPVEEFLTCVNGYSTIQEALAAWTTKATKEMMEAWSIQPTGPSKVIYSIKNSDFENMLAYYGNQEIFNSGMESTVEIAANEIENRQWTFYALHHFCAFRRRKIAEWQNKAGACWFGFPRAGPFVVRSFEMMTAFHEPYESLGKHLQILHESELQRSPELEVPTPMPKYFYAKGSRKNALGAFYIQIQGKPIEMSSYSFLKHHFLEHTPTQHVEILLEEGGKIYEACLKENDITQLLDRLGELFKILCEAKASKFGDPSIAELMIRAILRSKKWDAVGWKKGIIPWVEASRHSDGNEFGRVFVTLLEGLVENSSFAAFPK